MIMTKLYLLLILSVSLDNNQQCKEITNQKSIQKAVQQIQQHTDCLYGLVNIAGFFDQFPLVEAKPERFYQLINIHLVGQQHITQVLFPLLKQAKGRVINLSSETVLPQMPIQAYGLSKKLFDIWSTQLRMGIGSARHESDYDPCRRAQNSFYSEVY